MGIFVNGPPPGSNYLNFKPLGSLGEMLSLIILNLIGDLTAFPRIAGTLHSLLVNIQSRFHEDYGSQAACHVGDFSGFVRAQGATYEGLLPV